MGSAFFWGFVAGSSLLAGGLCASWFTFSKRTPGLIMRFGAMLVAVYISNIPEAVAGTSAMRTGGWSRSRILVLWSSMAVVYALSSAGGYVFLSRASNHFLAIVDAFAGGAILMILANAMIPEADQRAEKLAGVATVLGFVAAVLLVVLEHGGGM